MEIIFQNQFQRVSQTIIISDSLARIMAETAIPFIQKIHELIKNQTSGLVDWDNQNTGFIIKNLNQFVQKILPVSFGIQKLDSFVRKLNRHGFKRLKIAQNKMRFFHKYFDRQGKNLHKIKRLTKQDFLPKHIKLRMIREQMQKRNNYFCTESKKTLDEGGSQSEQHGQITVKQQQIQNQQEQAKVEIKIEKLYSTQLPEGFTIVQFAHFCPGGPMFWTNFEQQKQAQHIKAQNQFEQFIKIYQSGCFDM